MKKSLNLGFFVSVLASGVILNSLPISETKYALHKIGPALQSDLLLRTETARHCGVLVSKSGTQVEKFFLERLPIPAKELPGGECTLLAVASKTTRLRLRSHWNFHMQVRDINGIPVAERALAVDFPRPLVLLPLVILLLALVFEFKGWGLGATLASYLFLLAGGGLIPFLPTVARSIRTAFREEQSWMGLLLILLWVALCRGHKTQTQRPFGATAPTARWLNRALLMAGTLWSPVATTLAGRLMLPVKNALSRIQPLLDLQAVAVLLSVYLLAVDPANPWALFTEGISLPRYFTFGVLIFLFFNPLKLHREPVVWHLPGFGWAVAFVIAFEVWALTTSFWDGTPTLLRVGSALVLSQVLWPSEQDWYRVGKEFGRWGAYLLVAASVSVLSSELSATDLSLMVFDPTAHPTAVVFFTFLSAMALGFVTGNFSVAFFAIFTALTPSVTNPLVKAALLDGILAGMLLSPFSLLNLIPAGQFGIPIAAVLAHRFKQLAFPLGIGLVIYAVSAINSVAILRPATFVFLCLVAVVIQLKRGAWKLKHYTISPDLRSAES